MISEHYIDNFNGIYYKAENWNENAHFAKVDRTAHLYNRDDLSWCFDNREYNGNEAELGN